MKIKALIAVRSGSVRVENKNIKPFAGTTLLDIKIKQLLQIKGLDGIIVNSNDEEILGLAAKYPVTLTKRDQRFATNEVLMSDVYENMAQHADTDVIMYSNVTNPLLNDHSIEEMISLFRRGGDFDSVNSVHAIKEFMYQDGKAINYDPLHQPRSQDLPNIVAINFALSLISKENMIKYKNVVGHKPHLFEIDEIEAIDIDTILDFEIAEFLYQRKLNEKLD
jgi:CMP-N,N'-diacetyllegionaminic acid synthase